MSGNHSKSRSRFNKTLMDRIDNMPSDGDYNPYAASKKSTINNDELFSDNIYTSTEEDEREAFRADKTNYVIIAITAIVIIAFVVCMYTLVTKYLV